MKKASPYKIAIYIVVAITSVVCFMPMLLAIIVSFSTEESIMRQGYSLFPMEWSIGAYRMIFSKGSRIVQSYGVSIAVTLCGTFLAVAITCAASYTLSFKDNIYAGRISMYFFVTMVFGAGMVPWYLICIKLGLRNNFLALIVPSLMFSPFNMFLVRNFMQGLPDSLRESATIDGANDLHIAWKIYMPLSIPVVATVSLFYGLSYWNSWWNAIMLVDNRDLYPLQYLLLQIRSQVQMMRDLQSSIGETGEAVPTETLKMATAIVTIGPIVLLYPYLQKYFVTGLTIGSVKG